MNVLSDFSRYLLAAASLPSLLLALAGCTGLDAPYPTEGGPRVLVIHGMLVADTAEQEILVEYTRLIEEGLYRGGLTPASGATVSVQRAGTVHVFTEDPAEPGLYRASFTPRTGERYKLRIEGPTGEVATAETVVPGTPRIMVPAADTAIEPVADPVLGDSVMFRWTSATGAGYVVVRRHPTLNAPARRLSYLDLDRLFVFQDTALWLYFGSILDFPAGARIDVVAVDSNYARFVSAEPIETVPESRARSTLEGGYGLFGAVAFSNTRTVLVRPEP